ncbi:GNAT family N-acetyltransferase [Dyadobacter sp. CY312]|uniref:GNAT family N-acetyltransferase n=1 Tax=Dyadobacter sp. CY312 TaxID=2907303 RepID=UPI001F1FFD24|nr:GNAT family N-acetyltransferase [Dyadobacter sp. CY312]MCE7043517.1 GNAT family N-acetyltransferase [Dyadobacter sp. CY312]
MSSNLPQTNRFILTKMVDGDQEEYYSLSCNEEVMKFVTGYALTREESDEMFKVFLLENVLDVNLGRYFVREKVTGTLIGAAKLDKVGEEIEVGYRIRQEYWGKGVATEVAEGLIRFAREQIGAKDVIAFVNINNAASIRVLEKVGMLNVELIEDLDEVKYKFRYAHQTKFVIKTWLTKLWD